MLLEKTSPSLDSKQLLFEEDKDAKDWASKLEVDEIKIDCLYSQINL